MANSSRQSYRPLQIILILFIISFGAYAVRFVLGLGSDTTLISVDPLKGFSTAAELNTRINHDLNLAGETGLIAKDHVRLENFLFLPPVAVVVSIVVCVGLSLYKKRRGVASIQPTTRWLVLTICAMCALLPLTFTIIVLTKHEFQSRRLRLLCGNQNTEPSVIQPGGTVRARIEYSPGIKSIRGLHSFDSVRINNLTYKSSTGETGIVNYGSLRGGSGTSPSEWQDFNRMLPEVRVNYIYIQFSLPDQTGLQDALVSGDVEAELEYPAWVQSDRSGTRTASIAGHISFWVADKRQAEFETATQKFQEWEENPTLDNISLYSLLVAGGVFMGVCNMLSERRK